MANPLFRKKSVDLVIQEYVPGEVKKAQLKRTLSVYDLTAMGIAAIIGAGIFSTIGNAAVNGGPAVSLLFIFNPIVLVVILG